MITVAVDPEGFDDWEGLHTLLRDSFAYMEGRIDPPSSLTRLTAEGLKSKAGEEHLILVLDDGAPIGCAFVSVQAGSLYVGKLAVAAAYRGRALARRMIDQAAEMARAKGCTQLELGTRIELVENHRAFQALGFEIVERTCHPGFTRPTSVRMVRRLL